MSLTEEEFEKLLDRPKKNELFEEKKHDIEKFNLYQPEYKNTDLDRSKWILYNFSDEILFNHTLNEFFLWDSYRWEEDNTLKIIDKIKLGIREIYHECSILEDDRERQKKADFAIKFENLQKDLGFLILEKLNIIENAIANNQKPFLDIKQAAEYLNISKFTLYNFTSKNIIPFHKAGRKIYFAKSDLDAFALNKRHRFKSRDEIECEAATWNLSGK